MGQCIAIETARARRALRMALGEEELYRRDRMKVLRAKRLERAQHGLWWSLSEWLGIRDGFEDPGSQGRVHTPGA
jgi:hypothetical protein